MSFPHKAREIFRPLYAGEILTRNNHQILDSVCQRKTRSGKSHDYRDFIVYEKLRFQNVFRPHEKEKAAFSNSSGLKSVYEKLRFQNVFRPHAKPAFFQISPV